MAKRQTEAARRAQQSEKRTKASGRDIAAGFLSRTDDGRLLATFPNHFGMMSKGPIDLSHLNDHPGICDAIAFGYVMHCVGVQSADRRYNMNQQLKSGFLRFLEDTTVTPLEIGQLSERTLRDFKVWLDDETTPGWTPSITTRSLKFQEIQLVLRQLLADNEWSTRLSPELKLLAKPYKGLARSVNHTDILDDASLELLYISAANGVEEVIRRGEAAEAALAEVLAGEGVTSPDLIQDDATRCAAFLLHQFGNRPPTFETISRKVSWSRAIDKGLFDQAIATLFPSLDDLLPLVLVLTLLFAFNPGVVLNMSHNDYDDDWFAGRKRIRLFPYKRRKHDTHRNSMVATDDFDNPARILSFLEMRTKRVRRIISRAEFSDRVFVRYTRTGRKGVALEISDRAWREALERFCRKHGIEYFTLQQIRPTTLDLVHELTGGNLLATQQMAGHESPDTTHEFYTSAAMQRRGEEMLAGGINQWWRFLSTGGKVDATERDRLNVDLGSATPGFGCTDPYDSPIPGESGTLCAAYGRCPICPHALIDLTSAHAYAYQKELLRQIDLAQSILGPAWLVRWAPVKEKLVTRCIAAFPRSVALASAKVSIPDLPPVD